MLHNIEFAKFVYLDQKKFIGRTMALRGLTIGHLSRYLASCQSSWKILLGFCSAHFGVGRPTVLKCDARMLIHTRFRKSTYISMISNTVTHLLSYTNTAIANIAGNSTPISTESPHECRYHHAECRCRHAERRCLCIERLCHHIKWRMFHDVSQCFKSVSWCFTRLAVHDVLFVVHDVLRVSRCITMFYKCFMMFYYV